MIRFYCKDCGTTQDVSWHNAFAVIDEWLCGGCADKPEPEIKPIRQCELVEWAID